jgi:hypothetical protein
MLSERQKEIPGTHKVRPVSQQALAFPQGFADEPDLTMFQISQAAVNNAGGPAAGSCPEVVLLKQENPALRPRALSRDGSAVDSTSNNDNVEILALERWPVRLGEVHMA